MAVAHVCANFIAMTIGQALLVIVPAAEDDIFTLDPIKIFYSRIDFLSISSSFFMCDCPPTNVFD